MGVAYYYFCDKCQKVVMIPMIPFEPSDPGEETPSGWVWREHEDYSVDLLCGNCK